MNRLSENTRRRLSGLAKFAAISGAGLAADILIFLALMTIGLSALLANLISATCAVSWVYFASVKRVFSYRGEFLASLFLGYLVYQAIAIAVASSAVELLVNSALPPLAAKLVILPLTFVSNYAFMAWLTRRGGSGSN